MSRYVCFYPPRGDDDDEKYNEKLDEVLLGFRNPKSRITAIYKNEQGQHIQVSEVASIYEAERDPSLNDLECVGVVTEFVRRFVSSGFPDWIDLFDYPRFK